MDPVHLVGNISEAFKNAIAQKEFDTLNDTLRGQVVNQEITEREYNRLWNAARAYFKYEDYLQTVLHEITLRIEKGDV